MSGRDKRSDHVGWQSYRFSELSALVVKPDFAPCKLIFGISRPVEEQRRVVRAAAEVRRFRVFRADMIGWHIECVR